MMISSALEQQLVTQAANDDIERLVVGAIITNNERILVLERAADDFMGGIEEFPSGNVEANESLEEALRREVLEETGLTVTAIGNYVFAFDYRSGSGKRTRQLNFLATAEPGTVQINPTEHRTYRWMSQNEIATSNLTDNVKELLLQTSRAQPMPEKPTL